jgi:hypothetical protein
VGSPPAPLNAMLNRDLDFWAPIFKSSGFRN